MATKKQKKKERKNILFNMPHMAATSLWKRITTELYSRQKTSWKQFIKQKVVSIFGVAWFHLSLNNSQACDMLPSLYSGFFWFVFHMNAPFEIWSFKFRTVKLLLTSVLQTQNLTGFHHSFHGISKQGLCMVLVSRCKSGSVNWLF